MRIRFPHWLMSDNEIYNLARLHGLFDNGKKDVIFDIDGTLADITHRLRYVQQEPKNWKEFFAHLDQDKPRVEIVEKVKTYAEDYNIVLVTGRPEEHRKVTEEWLKKNDITYQTLIMRPKGDRRDDDVLKEEILNKYFKKDNIYLVFEDRKRVVDMWARNKIAVINVGGENSNF